MIESLITTSTRLSRREGSYFWSMSNKTLAAAYLYIAISHIEDNSKRILEKKIEENNS